jgi:hypothetical protein
MTSAKPVNDDMARHSGAYKWALLRIAECTELPFELRSDLAYLRSAVSLAHSFAKAGLLGKDPPPPKEVAGQLDLFAEKVDAA